MGGAKKGMRDKGVVGFGTGRQRIPSTVFFQGKGSHSERDDIFNPYLYKMTTNK